MYFREKEPYFILIFKILFGVRYYAVITTVIIIKVRVILMCSRLYGDVFSKLSLIIIAVLEGGRDRSHFTDEDT